MKKRFFNKNYEIKYQRISEEIKAVNGFFLGIVSVGLVGSGLVFGIGKLIASMPSIPMPEDKTVQNITQTNEKNIEDVQNLLLSAENKYRDRINSSDSNLKLIGTKDLTNVTLKIFENESENETVMDFINKDFQEEKDTNITNKNNKKDVIIAYKNLGTESCVNPNLLQLVQLSKTNYKIVDNVSYITWTININNGNFDITYNRNPDISTSVSQSSNIDWSTVSKTIPDYTDIGSDSNMHDYKDLIETSENKYRHIISDESLRKDKLSLLSDKNVAGLNINVFYNNSDKELVVYFKGSINDTPIDRIVAYKCSEENKKCSYYFATNTLYIFNDNMHIFVSVSFDKRKELINLSNDKKGVLISGNSSVLKIKDY